MKINWNDQWFFTEKFTKELPFISRREAEELEKEQKLTSVRVPHTVKLLPLNYCNEQDYQMESGYVHFLKVPEDWKGKVLLLQFGAVAHEAEVFCNGVSVYIHRCGYTAFTVDITKQVNYGADNQITLRVDSRETLNVPPFGHVIDYMTFGGIYRSVSLEVKEQMHLIDVFAHGGMDRNLQIACVVRGQQQGRIEAELKDKSGKVLAFSVKTLAEPEQTHAEQEQMHVEQEQAHAEQEQMHVEPEQTHAEQMHVEPEQMHAEPEQTHEEPEQTHVESEQTHTDQEYFITMEVPEARLWDIRTPHLYELSVILYDGTQEMDRRIIKTGFREVAFTEQGFYLNGRKLKLRGLNRHQSWPYMGYAAPDRAQALDADILKKELGCNAVRTSHYPQSHAFLDRCDELGLLVFTEMPGWQHIGDKNWKDQAVENTREMVLQYRNHPSIFLWGVRINESPDDDAFYQRTNEVAHQLDPTRPTGGVRCIKKSHLLEDVYTYNDFFHNGSNKGCEPKKQVTSDEKKGYLISEYNGHMFPTKSFDWEEKRLEHALRHATVLDEVRAQKDIAGCFGWCMFDYNTHQDFGSGDRICYHGVLDPFRNPKPAAAVYASQGLTKPILEISSSMDIGEHPACNLGTVYAFTNADAVELYKNGTYVASFSPDPAYGHLKHAPVKIDDTIGCLLEQEEGYDKKTADQVKLVMAGVAKYGQAALPPKYLLTAAHLMLVKHFTYEKANELYGKYIGNWGGKMTRWKFVAVKNGKPVAEVEKGPVETVKLECQIDTKILQERDTWDMATIRLRVVDEHHNLLPYYHGVVSVATEGPVELIGPSQIALQGGAAGTYVRTTGKTGFAKVILSTSEGERQTIELEVKPV